MATKKLQSELKTYLPTNQRGNADLDNLLDSVGGMLDDIRDTIAAFADYLDHENMPTKNLFDFSEQFGIEFPRNMNEDVRRLLVKDIINLHRANGSERSLRFVFKIVGLDIVIDYVWLLNPDETDPENFTYVYGAPQDDSNGTYFYGTDVTQTVEYNKLRIVGEDYPDDYTNSTDEVASLPYIRITVTAEDYDTFTDDYVDPDTGTTYSYTETEQFKITQEIRDYFLGRARPANVAVIEISTPFSLSDDLDHTTMIEDVSADSFVQAPTNPAAAIDGTIAIGTSVDRYTLGETWGGFQIGNATCTTIAANAPTNLLSAPDDLTDAAWTNTDVTLAEDADTSFTGRTDAWRLDLTTDNSIHTLEQDITKAASALDYTFGVKAKADGYDYVWLRLEDDGDPATNHSKVCFNLNAGTVQVASDTNGTFSAVGTASITDIGDGWYFCEYTANSGTETTMTAIINPSDDATYDADTGSGTDGILLKEPILEQASSPTRGVETVTFNYPIGTSGLQHFIPTRKNSVLVIDIPADAQVRILLDKSGDKGIIAAGTNTWLIDETINGPQTNYVVPVDRRMGVALNITTPSATGSIDVDVHHI